MNIKHFAKLRTVTVALPSRWAQQKGITSNIRPAQFGSMRGAAAAVDLTPYDTAISVPEDCLITVETAAQSDIVGPSFSCRSDTYCDHCSVLNAFWVSSHGAWWRCSGSGPGEPGAA